MSVPRRVVGVALGEVENPLSSDWLRRKSAISSARRAFDACLAEIASSQAADDFRQTEVPETVFSDALAYCPANHALVYLLATHWGGLALIVSGANSASGIKPHVLSLDLPGLTWHIVEGLIDQQIDVGFQDVIGGFAWGQTGSAFGRFSSFDWTGDTFAGRAADLHSACLAAHKQGSFGVAAQAICALPEFADILDVPLNELAHYEPLKLAVVAGTFDHKVLLNEIRRGLTILATVAMRPLAARLREQGVTGVSLIPCGVLATFPLLAAPVGAEQDDPLPGNWQTFADAFSNGASIIPSAWALVCNEKTQNKRKGLRAIGNPLSKGLPRLRWGQAEALTLTKLAGDSDAARIESEATREKVVADLKEALIYEASCHGIGGTGDFLDYCLFLANGSS